MKIFKIDFYVQTVIADNLETVVCFSFIEFCDIICDTIT